MIRNTHRRGDWLMRSDHNGHTYYASEMVRLWTGAWVHHSEFETRHPQEFVRARNDPAPLPYVRPEPLLPEACSITYVGQTVGETIGVTARTTVPFPQGPAFHLFDLGIGDMEIGCFVVR